MADTLRSAWANTLTLTFNTVKFYVEPHRDLIARVCRLLTWVGLGLWVISDPYAVGQTLFYVIPAYLAVRLTRALKARKPRKLEKNKRRVIQITIG